MKNGNMNAVSCNKKGGIDIWKENYRTVERRRLCKHDISYKPKIENLTA